MGENFDVVVLGAHGQGLSHAMRYLGEGLRSAYVDLAPRFSPWELADVAGPFGLAHPEVPLEVQERDLFTIQNEVEVLPKGITIATPCGVLETRGPLAEFQQRSLTNNGQDPWLIDLSANLASAYWSGQNGERLSSPIDFTARWCRDLPTALRLQQSYEWASGQGVSVFTDTLLDVSLHKSQVENIQLEKAGLIGAEHYVWSLPQQDIVRFPRPMGSKLYPRGVVAAVGAWVRFQIRWEMQTGVMRPPKMCILLGHVDLPWKRGNLMVVDDLPRTQQAFVWMRIPEPERFSRSSMEELAKDMQDRLVSYWPVADFEIQRFPVEYDHNQETLGPAPFSLYPREELRRPAAKNWCHAGVDAVGSLDRHHRWNFEAALAKHVAERWRSKRPKSAPKNTSNSAVEVRP